MAYTFDSALADDRVTVIDRDDDAGRYRIRIGSLETPVTITLRRLGTGETTEFIVSHAIQTPLQAGPYRTSRPFADYPAYALHKAIVGLTSEYRAAERKGHGPSEDWLVAN